MSEPTAEQRAAWRAQVQETALEPDLPIVDPHHHVWPDVGMMGEPYGLEDLAADKGASGHKIVATVFVEAHARYRTDGPEHLRCVGETEFAEQLGREADRRGGGAAGIAKGFVASAKLALGEAIDEVLEAHRAAAPDRLRGVRDFLAHDPEAPMPGSAGGRLADPSLHEGVRRLARHDLSLDLWLFHPQLPELARLARACPDTTMILDHVGAPLGVGRFAADRQSAFEDWKAKLAEVAALPNVLLKLGGLNMGMIAATAPMQGPRPWTSEQLAQGQRDHILTAIDLFGVGRCMFESNFPVDKKATNATPLWNGFKRIVADFSPADKAALFHDNAVRVYRLKLDG